MQCFCLISIDAEGYLHFVEADRREVRDEIATFFYNAITCAKKRKSPEIVEIWKSSQVNFIMDTLQHVTMAVLYNRMDSLQKKAAVPLSGPSTMNLKDSNLSILWILGISWIFGNSLIFCDDINRQKFHYFHSLSVQSTILENVHGLVVGAMNARLSALDMILGVAFLITAAFGIHQFQQWCKEREHSKSGLVAKADWEEREMHMPIFWIYCQIDDGLYTEMNNGIYGAILSLSVKVSNNVFE